MHAVEILTLNEVQQAQPVKERLEQAGISAQVKDERKIQKLIFLSPPLAGVHLRVDNGDFERAQHLLREWDRREGTLRQALHCPECGSSRVQFPQFTRKVFISWLGALACAVGLMKRKFYCKQCHFTWPVQPDLEPQKDVLGWPKREE